MRIIKYNLCTRVNYGTEEVPLWEEIISPVEMVWNEANEDIAKREAYKGEYTIEENGEPTPERHIDADGVLNILLGVGIQ